MVNAAKPPSPTGSSHSEATVTAREQAFRSYFENSPIAILVVDAEGRIEECNPAATHMLGYDLPSLTRLTVFNLHSAEEHAQVHDRLQSLGAGGLVNTEVRWFRSDGSEVWGLLRAVPLENGRSIGFCQDITDHRRAELDLLRSRRLLEAFIDLAPIGIAMFDRELRYIRCSRLWQFLMARNDADLVGHYHYEDFTAVPVKWRQAHERGLAGEIAKGEDEWLAPNGKRIFSHWEVHPWGDSGVDSGGIIIMFQDMTEARAMESELRHAHKMEALGQLAGGVAHDFNNLLQIIQGYTELLLDRSDKDELATKYKQEVLQAARRASSLTRQLLAFSRRQVFTPAVIDLNEVVQNTSKMLRRLLGENIEYHVELGDSLWRIEADADQVSQVLINLCVNSRDAMPTGGTLTITTRNQIVEASHDDGSSLPPGEYVALSVRDTGTGMDADVLEHIFEPFFTTKESGKGTGLGLSTVYGIVRQSEGHIRVESAPGEGTRITVFLPRSRKSKLLTTRGREPQMVHGQHTVLVVEDDSDVRAAVGEFLPTLGYKVLTATPAQAVSIAREYDGVIDLLITDVVMPEVSGPELAEKIRAVRPGLRTVFMSGYIDDAVTRHGVLQSNHPFLQKPFALSEMAEAIRKALAQK